MKRVLEASRYLILIAVFASLAAAAAAFVWGAYKTVLVIMELIVSRGQDPLSAVSLIELMDKFMIATGLYIFAVGIYELFIGDLDLPDWLTVHSLHGIKGRLSSVIILVMAIVFLERFIQGQDPQSTLFMGVAVALVTAALIAFSTFGGKE